MDEADAAALLAQVEQDPAALGRDPLERRVELAAAVAAGGREDVAGQALRVDAHEHRVARRGPRPSPAPRGAGRRSGSRRRGCGSRRTRSAGWPRRSCARAARVCIRYWMRSRIVIIRMPCSRQKRLELRHARHRPVLVHHLADDAGRVEARQPREVHRGLGLAGALRARRPARRAAGTCGRAARGPPAASAGRSRRARSSRGRRRRCRWSCPCVASIGTQKAVPNCARVLLVADHQRDAQLVEPLAGHRQADEAAAVAGHEVDRLGRHLLGRDREVALVLAVLVVDDDDHLARPGSPRGPRGWS